MRIIGLFLIIFLGFYGVADAAERGHANHGQVSPVESFLYEYSNKDLEEFRQFLTSSRRLNLLDKAIKQASSLKNLELRQKAYAVMAYKFLYIGNLERAAEFAAKVANHELKWRVYYALAVEGYSPRGDMEDALLSAETSMNALSSLIGVAEKELTAKFLATQYNKLLVDIIVSRIETGKYGDEILPVMSKINDKLHCWLMVVEQSTLRLYSRQKVEKFLAFMGYELYEPGREELLSMPDALAMETMSDLPAVYYRNATRNLLLAVKYGMDEETGLSAFIVYSVLTPEQTLSKKNVE